MSDRKIQKRVIMTGKKGRVLEFFLKNNALEIEVNYRALIEEFKLKPAAACNWLARLQRQGLIQDAGPDNRKSYVLTKKGKERLNWLQKKSESKKYAEEDDWI